MIVGSINKGRQNLHTHTIYCDGRNTPEEMILAACEKGFSSIGFSMHSFLQGQTIEQTIIESYKKDVDELKNKYADKIDVYCGLECDMYGTADLTGFDYLIGAVHYLRLGDMVVSIDHIFQDTQSIIRQYFGGDGMACAKEYYRQLSKMPQYGKYDIVAHFDIITKYNEKGHFFDENSKEYFFAAIEAAEQLAGTIPYFEVNTGAVARGYRTAPYPSINIIKELKRLGLVQLFALTVTILNIWILDMICP